MAYRARHTVLHRKRIAEKEGLSPAQYGLLRTLRASGPTRVTDLASSQGVTPGAVTGLAKNLWRSGLISRRRSAEDQRIVYLSLTDKGRELLDRVDGLRRESMVDMVVRLTTEEAETLLGLIAKVLGQDEGSDPGKPDREQRR